MSIDINEMRVKSLSSLLYFTQLFFETKTGREFQLSQPIGRESHFVTIIDALEAVLRGELPRLIINVPPRYGKTNLIHYFTAWGFANYPDSNFIYTSYAKSLAKLQTQTIRDIISMPLYRKLFNVGLSEDSTAKDDWSTTHGGTMFAAGSGGPITGRGAGIKGSTRFGGCVLLDDLHKPIEVTSDVMRKAVIDWYDNTLKSRTNDKNTPIIFIGQRLHEDDLPANLIKTGDWHIISLDALDKAGNALYPEMHDKEALLKMEEQEPYVFASQYQQNPQPAGGGIFKPEWFVLLDQEPDITTTFLTVDSAETDKSYNDATVFSFWGIYKIIIRGIDTGLIGLHWIDCHELRIEPKDLENEFWAFWASCMRYRVKPKNVAIEKKSTGVTLLSTVKNTPGLSVTAIERTRASGDKTSRFLEMQPYVASKRISLPRNARHVDMVLEHMRKITANNTHRHDDICDTAYDAVKLGLIDGIFAQANTQQNDTILKEMAASFNLRKSLRESRTW